MYDGPDGSHLWVVSFGSASGLFTLPETGLSLGCRKP
jgi:hypothetical protein